MYNAMTVPAAQANTTVRIRLLQLTADPSIEPAIAGSTLMSTTITAVMTTSLICAIISLSPNAGAIATYRVQKSDAMNPSVKNHFAIGFSHQLSGNGYTFL